MSPQAARTNGTPIQASPSQSSTSYGQVIEYIQSASILQLTAVRRLLCWLSLLLSHASQIESTWLRTLIRQTKTRPFPMQPISTSRRPSDPPSHPDIPLQRSKPVLPSILPSTSLSTMTYSTTASMRISDLCILATSIASLYCCMTSWEIPGTRIEALCSGADPIQGAGRTPPVCLRAT